MSNGSDDPRVLLERSLESDRLHSAYLISGSGSEPREAALAFVRGLAGMTRPALAFVRGMVCRGGPRHPCEACAECRRSNEREEIVLDGTGRNGPLLRHVGDHPDLLWVERGANDTRVRIGQIRALQHALRLRGEGGGRRAGVIADAEWLNVEAQNALLRLLEEPPPRTTLVLVAATSAGLLATVRSRCQRVAFRVAGVSPLEDPERGELVAKLEGLATDLCHATEQQDSGGAEHDQKTAQRPRGAPLLRHRADQRGSGQTHGDGAADITDLVALIGVTGEARRIGDQRRGVAEPGRVGFDVGEAGVLGGAALERDERVLLPR